MKSKSDLPLTEELDFAYLLGLLPPLYDQPEFAWLPELFSIIGHERLLTLCKYAGGETIQIPTLDQMNESIESLQWFHDVYITRSKKSSEIPPELISLVKRVKQIYDVRDS